MPDERRTDDHVVPENIFLLPDRREVFILDAHDHCNRAKSRWDEPIGQLFKLLHGTLPAEQRKHKLELIRFIDTSTGEDFGGVGGLELNRIVRGWLMGFHAQLYREYLPPNQPWAYSPPLPSFTDPSKIDAVQTAHSAWVATIKANRLAGTVDRVVAWNGKLVYECTWDALDDNRTPACVFALDIYGWARLAASPQVRQRSCVGMYHPVERVPREASRVTSLAFPITNRNPFDAFAE